MPQDRPGAKTMVNVDHVSMIFNVASEQLNSLKEYAIALSRRELRFKEFRALDDVSFQVKQGDVFGILGTNGSGKSTMLKIIAGVLEPSKGTCTVEGNVAPLIELGAGFDMELTARENIYLNGALLGYSKKFIQQHFDEIVEFAEVGDFLEMPMKNYSSGMVARIAFAIATVIVPDVLIVDEVLSVGDFMFQQKCERRIQTLIKDHGVTVLIVSHNNDQIERLCTKAAWIEKGHLRAIGAAKDVCELYRAIGGRPGSPDSERIILDLLTKDVPVPSSLTANVSGDDRFSTAIKANEYVDAPSETIILINSEYEEESRIATALAGALDASILFIQKDRMPDVTAQEIKHRRPSKIVMVGGKDEIGDGLVESVFDDGCKAVIKRISGAEETLSIETFDFALENGADWGSTAVVSERGQSNAMLALSPYLFAKKAPVFYLDEQRCLSDKEMHALDAFERIVVASAPDIPCITQLNELGKEVIRFDASDDEEPAVNEWLRQERLREQGESGNTPISLVVTSPASYVDNHILGPLAGRLSAVVLLEDPQLLDSMAAAIRYVRENKDAIGSVVYLGDKLRFSPLNKSILAKAIVEKQGSSFAALDTTSRTERQEA